MKAILNIVTLFIIFLLMNCSSLNNKNINSDYMNNLLLNYSTKSLGDLIEMLSENDFELKEYTYLYDESELFSCSLEFDKFIIYVDFDKFEFIDPKNRVRNCSFNLIKKEKIFHITLIQFDSTGKKLVKHYPVYMEIWR